LAALLRLTLTSAGKFLSFFLGLPTPLPPLALSDAGSTPVGSRKYLDALGLGLGREGSAGSLFDLLLALDFLAGLADVLDADEDDEEESSEEEDVLKPAMTTFPLSQRLHISTASYLAIFPRQK